MIIDCACCWLQVAEQRALSSRPGSRRSVSRNSLGSARSGSAVSAPGSASLVHHNPASAAGRLTLEETGAAEEFRPGVSAVDTSYSDPLGPAPERPRTSAGNRLGQDDEFADEEIGDDLLPE